MCNQCDSENKPNNEYGRNYLLCPRFCDAIENVECLENIQFCNEKCYRSFVEMVNEMYEMLNPNDKNNLSLKEKIKSVYYFYEEPTRNCVSLYPHRLIVSGDFTEEDTGEMINVSSFYSKHKDVDIIIFAPDIPKHVLLKNKNSTFLYYDIIDGQLRLFENKDYFQNRIHFTTLANKKDMCIILKYWGLGMDN